MKTKHKKQRVFTSSGNSKKPMQYKQRMIWVDENGYYFYKTQYGTGMGFTKIVWQPVRQVTGDVWIVDHKRIFNSQDDIQEYFESMRKGKEFVE